MNIKLDFKAYRNQDLNDELINQIALFKNQTWIYTLESQIQFLKDNFKTNDFHIFIQLNNEIVSYLSVLNIDVYLNGVISTIKGIGSICTSPYHRKKGYANKLLEYTDEIVLKKNPSILLCQDQLTNFYINLNWHVLKRDHYFKEKKFNIMAKYLSSDNKITLTRLF
jgi:predicted acetyltransferase